MKIGDNVFRVVRARMGGYFLVEARVISFDDETICCHSMRNIGTRIERGVCFVPRTEVFLTREEAI
ncbi:hypothetical protein LCGC14_2526660, partial [marine sediment metagenome]